MMEFEFDPEKDARNQAKHGLSLADFSGFDADPVVVADDRRDYGEERFRAFGMVDGKPHSIAFTVRGNAMRLISFRRAHAKELKRYDR
jgi:uncharacterized protein